MEESRVEGCSGCGKAVEFVEERRLSGCGEGFFLPFFPRQANTVRPSGRNGGGFCVVSFSRGVGTMKWDDVLSGARFQRKLSVAVMTVVLLGVMAAFAAARQDAEVRQTESISLPLSGLTILVDPGHGGYDGGARARDSGVWEKHINLQVALKTEAALKAQGAQVVMTRREDDDLCTEDRPAGQTKKRQDMEARVDLARDSGAAMVISIHMNEYRQRSQSGPQVFYREGSDSSRLLAGCMQEALVNGLNPSKKRVAMAGDYFILQLEVPSVLVECGFISNSAEEKLLLDGAYQEKIAQAIAAAAAEYVTLSARTQGQ